MASERIGSLGCTKCWKICGPAQAALILEGTPEAISLEVLMLMNQAKAGRALAAMNPAKAAVLAAKLGAPRWEDRAC